MSLSIFVDDENGIPYSNNKIKKMIRTEKRRLAKLEKER